MQRQNLKIERLLSSVLDSQMEATVPLSVSAVAPSFSSSPAVSRRPRIDCGSCGNVMLISSGDRFCGHCGVRLFSK
jgi:ribosomal protein S27AE